MATKAKQRPSKEVIEIFDELLDVDNNDELKHLMKYRFFGTSIPPKNDVDIFLNYDSMINEDYVDQDKIYWQILKLHRKCFFESQKYQEKVISKKMQFELIWSTPDTLAECFEAIILGLKHSKQLYHQNNSRTKARLAAKAAKAAELKRKKEVKESEEDEEDEYGEGDQSHNHNQRRRRRHSKVFFFLLLYYNFIFKFALIIHRKKPQMRMDQQMADQRMKEVIN